MARQRKTNDYEIKWAKDELKETVRAESASDAASIAARRHGADGARLVPGATYRYQTVTSAPGGGTNLGAEFWVSQV